MSRDQELLFETSPDRMSNGKNDADAPVIVPTSTIVPTSKSETDDLCDFAWGEDPSIVVPSQPAVAVYFNPRGEVVIRQESQFHPDEDHFVYVQIKNLPPLISRLLQVVRCEVVPVD